MAKQTKITIETESFLILRGTQYQPGVVSSLRGGREVIALEDIGVISNLERSAFEQWLNSPELHRSETPTGSTRICLNSLLARVQKTKAI